jgi:GT2 family glycosyltransferase
MVVTNRVPRVSVVVPTFRRAEFLPRAIASVQQQSVDDWELIIVDDNEPGSRERSQTEELLESYAYDRRILYVRHSTNQGGGAARNTGIRAASGPFVAFLDDDDEWDQRKLEAQLALIEDEQAQDIGLVYCRFTVVEKATGRVREHRTHGGSPSVRQLLMRNEIGTTSCVLCRATALHEVGLFDEDLPARQDVDLYIRLAQRYAVAFVDESLVTLHIHGRPSISTDLDGSIRAHALFVAKYQEHIESDPDIVRALEHELGRLLVAAERYPEARAALVKAWRLGPTDLDVLVRLAMTFCVPRAFVGPTKRIRAMLRDFRA